MTVIIIEDEPLLAAAIEKEIRAYDASIEVPARLASIADALDYFSEHALPDLFFSDIQLSDGLSFEIFRTLKSTKPVVFCTAYNEYALEAFQQNGIDYLLKPLEPAKLRATLTKYRELVRPVPFSAEDMLRHFGTAPKPAGRNLLVSRGDRIIPVKKADIAVFVLVNGITYAHTLSGEKYALDQTLEEIERGMEINFYRANRQVIVNRAAIGEVKRYIARKLRIKTIPESPIPVIVSKAKASGFLDWLAT